jgi:hypothetical protein
MFLEPRRLIVREAHGPVRERVTKKVNAKVDEADRSTKQAELHRGWAEEADGAVARRSDGVGGRSE